MKKCELELELYEAPRVVVLTMQVERGFSASIGEEVLPDFSEDDGIADGYEQEEI